MNRTEKLPISACIITLNEEKNIKACIESLNFASEVIVVDSFSSDKTEDICLSLGARFYKHKFEGHIEQKNIALSYASHAWVLSLDADERVSEGMRREIYRIFKGPTAFDGYRFRRCTWYLDRWIRHGRFYPDKQLRLFRKEKARWGGVNPHDKIQLQGNFKDINEEIYHYSYQDLAHHIRTLNSFSGIQAKNLFEKKNLLFPVTKMIAKSLWTIFDSYILRRGFLDGRPGVIIAVFSGFSMFARYAKLYELNLVAQNDGKVNIDAGDEKRS